MLSSAAARLWFSRGGRNSFRRCEYSFRPCSEFYSHRPESGIHIPGIDIHINRNGVFTSPGIRKLSGPAVFRDGNEKASGAETSSRISPVNFLTGFDFGDRRKPAAKHGVQSIVLPLELTFFPRPYNFYGMLKLQLPTISQAFFG